MRQRAFQAFVPHGDLPKSASRDHPSLECLLGGGGHDACFRCTRYVGERAINGRERHAVAHGPLVFSQRRVVDDDAPTPPAEGPGNGDVDLGGHGVGQSVDGKGGVVGGRAASPAHRQATITSSNGCEGCRASR